ncbi:histidine phosphatase family protein [Paenibacillus aurantius]|uniref:Histidine phosphatase family protein n=1 Tax=Paenibacillus aurantius TaxID=2918900 RepID=A0AA96RIR4_9BACL|nr:histidine phosphatase family protein [Paenibacillus aurantius]WNQ12464.1 histidine phosphatase family protein [Paenibacillus aurantius]
MTTIGFVRHGVTDWNVQGRAQGQHDVPLNELGREQARMLGKRLAAEGWDLIFSSDLSRARETADAIAEAMGRSVDGYDVRLREKTHGRLDGTVEAERVEKWGPNWRELDHDEESAESVRERSLDFLKEITETYPGRKVLVVSHGAWIGITLETLLPGQEIAKLTNTSVCVLEKAEGTWTCLLMNCIKHLENVG